MDPAEGRLPLAADRRSGRRVRSSDARRRRPRPDWTARPRDAEVEPGPGGPPDRPTTTGGARAVTAGGPPRDLEDLDRAPPARASPPLTSDPRPSVAQVRVTTDLGTERLDPAQPGRPVQRLVHEHRVGDVVACAGRCAPRGRGRRRGAGRAQPADGRPGPVALDRVEHPDVARRGQRDDVADRPAGLGERLQGLVPAAPQTYVAEARAGHHERHAVVRVGTSQPRPPPSSPGCRRRRPVGASWPPRAGRLASRTTATTASPITAAGPCRATHRPGASICTARGVASTPTSRPRTSGSRTTGSNLCTLRSGASAPSSSPCSSPANQPRTRPGGPSSPARGPNRSDSARKWRCGLRAAPGPPRPASARPRC